MMMLSITNATPFVTHDGVQSLTVFGMFNYDDLLQFSVPAGLIISQGSQFVRYDISGQIAEGTSPAIANGIVATDIPALLGLGTPACGPATLTQLRVDRISVTLPADFSPGPVSVILYAVPDGSPFVSNAVSATLPLYAE